MLFYNYISEFQIELNTFDYIELIGWIIVCVEMSAVALYFSSLGKQNKRAYFIGLFFALFVGSRICRIIARFLVGESSGGAVTLGGSPTLLTLQMLYNMFSYIGLFFLYYVLESGVLKKTHYFFSFIVIVAIILSFVQYAIDIFFIMLPVYAIALLGLPIIFFNLAIKTSAAIRRNSLLVAFGILLFEIAIIIDIPEASQFWDFLMGLDQILRIVAPFMQIVGIYMIMKGFPKEY